MVAYYVLPGAGAYPAGILPLAGARLLPCGSFQRLFPTALSNGSLQRLSLSQGVRLLPYGVLAGGFLSERWLGVPAAEVTDLSHGSFPRLFLAALSNGSF